MYKVKPEVRKDFPLNVNASIETFKRLTDPVILTNKPCVREYDYFSSADKVRELLDILFSNFSYFDFLLWRNGYFTSGCSIIELVFNWLEYHLDLTEKEKAMQGKHLDYEGFHIEVMFLYKKYLFTREISLINDTHLFYSYYLGIDIGASVIIENASK